ncbi:class I SAM-dependent methyltransferase [Azospirillum thermophilum]|uniref:Methyltransferase type 12 domain-containing protein n=1 Tax=Azospirillum thermophilum TaxID=2202148 RepID=A0A2S2CTM1_9PROT|nr:class I SAM-dependent methyltransferase [Azospirillum thermophilum]AWK87720.1 hypothetical protein DEW08_17255 [Azospirillum thermophilum]
MNPGTPAGDGSILYYDADYPSLELGPARAEDVAALARVGMLGDVAFYLEAAAGLDRVLEVGCGTGRLAIPLARQGAELLGVDVSGPMLDRLRARLAAEPPEVVRRVRLIEGDAADLDLSAPDPAYPDLAGWRADLVLLPFNLLMLAPDAGHQRRVLAAAARHLRPGGRLVLDVMNPLALPLEAERRPSPSQPRVNPETGNRYVRHAQAAAMDETQVQRLSGWYDELLPDGGIRSTSFAFAWRMVYREELERMLAETGFAVEAVSGGFDGTPWTERSSRIIVRANTIV